VWALGTGESVGVKELRELQGLGSWCHEGWYGGYDPNIVGLIPVTGHLTYDLGQVTLLSLPHPLMNSDKSIMDCSKSH
jgi:hypothetical protein